MNFQLKWGSVSIHVGQSSGCNNLTLLKDFDGMLWPEEYSEEVSVFNTAKDSVTIVYRPPEYFPVGLDGSDTIGFKFRVFIGDDGECVYDTGYTSALIRCLVSMGISYEIHKK